VALFSGAVLTATPTEPAYDDATNTLTVPSITGVTYYIDDVAQVAGPVVLTANKIVEARPNLGYKFPPTVDTDWAKGDF
jgi:hypothetical protein